MCYCVSLFRRQNKTKKKQLSQTKPEAFVSFVLINNSDSNEGNNKKGRH